MIEKKCSTVDNQSYDQSANAWPANIKGKLEILGMNVEQISNYYYYFFKISK